MEVAIKIADNMPVLANKMAERIAQGKSDIVLLASAENLAALLGALKTGVRLDWIDSANSDPLAIGAMKPGCNEHENGKNIFRLG